MKKIFEKTNLNNLSIKNRLIRSATMEFGLTQNGKITEKYLNLYKDLAKGNAGLIITGAMAVNEDAQVKCDMVNIYDDDFISDFSKVTECVHKNGSKIAPQLAHGGIISAQSESSKRLAPSAFMGACEMTEKDIKKAVLDFKNAAVKCKMAGADAVEIHCAHGFLISQFLSPIFNKRTDEYGIKNKKGIKFMLDVIDSVREGVGDDFPIIIKLNHSDLMKGGMTLEDSLYICKEIDNKNLAAIEISSGLIHVKECLPARIIKNKDNEGYNKDAADSIAESIKTPVICVGGFRSFSSIESFLNDSKVSSVSLCRPLICEPDLPLKWEKDNSYRPKCVSCNRCFYSDELKCALNKNSLN